MCDYGKVRKENLKPHDIKEILSTVFNNIKKLPEVLLLNSLGSVLDTEEMPIENIITLLDEFSHRDFIEVLDKIPKEYIDRIYLCWYGNREITYDKNKTIFPKCNDDEYQILMGFYREFNMTRNTEKRIELLKLIKLKI